MTRLDDNWEWIEVRQMCDRQATYVRGQCLHTRTVEVESTVTGEVLALLCLVCDAQLPADWVERFPSPTHAELNTSTVEYLNRPSTTTGA